MMSTPYETEKWFPCHFCSYKGSSFTNLEIHFDHVHFNPDRKCKDAIERRLFEISRARHRARSLKRYKEGLAKAKSSEELMKMEMKRKPGTEKTEVLIKRSTEIKEKKDD